MPNAVTWFDNTVQKSIKSGDLRRGKRFEAVVAFWKRMRDENEKYLIEMDEVVIWAPAPDVMGMAYPVKEEKGQAMVYLSPSLELEKMPSIIWTVAHEFAHIYLQHHKGHGEIKNNKPGAPHDHQPAQIAADTLVENWRFRKPKKGNSFFSKMLRTYAKESGRRNRKLLAGALGIETQ